MRLLSILQNNKSKIDLLFERIEMHYLIRIYNCVISELYSNIDAHKIAICIRIQNKSTEPQVIKILSKRIRICFRQPIKKEILFQAKSSQIWRELFNIENQQQVNQFRALFVIIFAHLFWCPSGAIPADDCFAESSIDKLIDFCEKRNTCEFHFGNEMFGNLYHGTFKYYWSHVHLPLKLKICMAILRLKIKLSVYNLLFTKEKLEKYFLLLFASFSENIRLH